MTEDVAHEARRFIRSAYDESGDSESLAHALTVGGLLADTGCEDHVVVAGYLHDVVEDTDVTVAALRASFGDRAGRLVAALTDDETIPDPRERRSALREQVALAPGMSRWSSSPPTNSPGFGTPNETGSPIEPTKLEHYRRS